MSGSVILAQACVRLYFYVLEDQLERKELNLVLLGGMASTHTS